MSNRKLATVEVIKDLQPAQNSDNLLMAKIRGWNCITSKSNNFSIGDKVIYFEVDSLLPEEERFEFLRKSSYSAKAKGFRIKTMKLRGNLSQGLILPLADLQLADSLEVGTDLTEELGVRVYDEVVMELTPKNHNILAPFPYFASKTDAERWENLDQSTKDYLLNTPLSITEKLDGSSATYFVRVNSDKTIDFGICSRNFQVKGDIYETIADKYKLEAKMVDLIDVNLWNDKEGISVPIVIQGEIVGPGVNGNRHSLKELDFYVYSVYCPDTHYYADEKGRNAMCSALGLKPVPTLSLEAVSEEALKQLATSESALGGIKEGIVIRPNESMSREESKIVKLLNVDYLLKHDL